MFSMKKLIAELLTYGIYGLLAAALVWLVLPNPFAGSVVSFLAFAKLMSFSMFAGNFIELKTWQTLSTEQADILAWRVVVRLSIYLVLPSLLVWAAGALGVFTLQAGFISAFGMCFLPLMIASYLKLFPAGAQR